MTGDSSGGRRPVVSIGLPVYNGARFLRESIPSLINQTFRDFELIVADNASTDATQEICRSFAQSDSRIRYSRSDRNRGLAWNHNHIVELARGEFFKWVGHDDVYEPRFIERCVDVFRSDSPAVVLVYPRSRIIDESGSVLWEHCDGLDLQERTPHERLKRLVWNPPTMGTSIYGLIRTTALRQTQLLQPFASTTMSFSPNWRCLASSARFRSFSYSNATILECPARRRRTWQEWPRTSSPGAATTSCWSTGLCSVDTLWRSIDLRSAFSSDYAATPHSVRVGFASGGLGCERSSDACRPN